MLTITFPAQAFGTNCYVLAPRPGGDCVVVDPGIGIDETLAEVLQAHRLTPAGIVLTHGHVDHVYSVSAAGSPNIPTFIHRDDRYRLVDPLSVSSLGPALFGALEQQFGPQPPWTEPTNVVEYAQDDIIDVAGLSLRVIDAPGHTEGSVLLEIDGLPEGLPDEVDVRRTILSGDVLFAGSIGRTDLPGGDDAVMQTTLAEVVLTQADETLVLPGHGPASTIARERATNPHLLQIQGR